MSLRVLVILPRIPIPARDGAEVVMSQTLVRLSQTLGAVDVFALNPSRQQRPASALSSLARNIGIADIDTRVRVTALLRQLLLPRRINIAGEDVSTSYWLSRFIDIKALQDLRRFVEKHGPYDVIHCETLFTAYYGLQLGAPTLVLRSHNVEWKIQEHLASEHGNWSPKAIIRRILALQTRRFEEFVAKRIQRIACVSEADAEWYRSHSRGSAVRHVPPGIEEPEGVDEHSTAPHTNAIGFIGSLDWEPNRLGLQWFLTEVLPKILEKRPDTRFSIAGRGSSTMQIPSEVRHATSILGEVDSSSAFLRAQNVVISPLFSGSGIRIKLLEAFAHRKAVVTTTKGAEGLPVRNGIECMLADEPLSFAEQCVELLNNPETARKLGLSATLFVRAHYSWQTSIASLVEMYANQ